MPEIYKKNARSYTRSMLWCMLMIYDNVAVGLCEIRMSQMCVCRDDDVSNYSTSGIRMRMASQKRAETAHETINVFT